MTRDEQKNDIDNLHNMFDGTVNQLENDKDWHLVDKDPFTGISEYYKYEKNGTVTIRRVLAGKP